MISYIASLLLMMLGALAQPQPNPQIIRFVFTGHILIPARLADAYDAMLLYDPVQGVMLDQDFVRRSGMRTYSGPELGLGVVRAGGAGAAEYDVRFARDLKINAPPVLLTQPLAPVIPLDSAMAPSIGRHVDGLFGVDLLQRYLVEFDFGKQYLVLHDSARHELIGGYSKLPMRRHGARVAVPLTIVVSNVDTIRGNFVLDFGMSGTLRLSTRFTDSLNLLARIGPSVRSNAEHGLGGALSSVVTRMKAVRIGDVVFSDVVTSLAREASGGDANPPYDGLIGLDLIRRLRILYRHSDGLVLVRPSENPGVFRHLNTGVLLVPTTDSTNVQISRVVDGSDAAKAGLRAGDVVISVNGQATRGWSGFEWRRALESSVGSTAAFVIEREGVRAQISLPVIDYLRQ